MKFKVRLSQTAIKYLTRLDKGIENRLREGLKVLKEDPFKKRPGADIKKLKGFRNPSIWRIRIGNQRAAYTVEDEIVKITEIFPRGKGYKWL